MKKAIFYFSFLLINTVAIAQKQGQEMLDSLQKQMPKIAVDSNKVKIILREANEYLNLGENDSARSVLKQGLAISRKIKFDLEEAMVLNMYGVSYFYEGNFKEALNYWNLALEKAPKENDEGLGNSIELNLANTMVQFGNYPEALKRFFTLLKKEEAKKDKDQIFLCLQNIALIYEIQNNLDKAVEYYQKAFSIYDKSGENVNQIGVCINLGELYYKFDDYKNAKQYYNRAFDLGKKLKNNRFLPNVYSGLGRINLADSNYTEAIQQLTQSLDLYKAGNMINFVGVTYENIAHVYQAAAMGNQKEFLTKYFNGNKEAALKKASLCADSALAIFKEIGDIENVRNVYERKYEIEKLRGNCTIALENFESFKSLNDSLFNMEKDKKITETGMQYDFDKKEAAAKAEQEKKDIQQRNIRYSISIGLAAAILFLLVVYRQRNKIKKEKDRSEELLLNILPAEVAEELKTKGSAEAQLIDEVTVLFTDFKGFTQLSEKLSPKELVADIHECFSAFDNIMHKHGVEKIKTIGDAYMAAGGLPTANKTHAEDVVNAAIDIQQFMHEHKAKREAEGKLFFEIRIGVHTGPVVAGIVGVKKFAYDIWGDTVNTASRMESSGEAGKINISETTYALVKDQFHCEYRGKIAAKGKGEMEMYFVENKNRR